MHSGHRHFKVCGGGASFASYIKKEDVMGCDIHWIIERKHPLDGRWEAVLSESTEWDRCTPEGEDWPDFKLRDPGMDFKSRDYSWFDILSSVRGSDQDAPHIVTDGFPGDVSLHAATMLGWGIFSDFHSHGSISIDYLHAIRDQGLPERVVRHADYQEVANHFIGLLDKMLAIYGPDGLRKILPPQTYNSDTNGYEVDRTKISNHELLNLEVRGQAWGPVDPKELRLLVAYDN